MIKIDFLLAISIYLSASLLFLLGKWILVNNKDRAIRYMSQDTKFILQCPICSFIYRDYTNGAVSICPRCESYSKREEAQL